MSVHNWVTIGRSGLGVVNMTGGQFNSDSQAFVVGIWGGSQGIWNQSGGALNVDQDIWIGQGAGDTNSHGVVNLSGGTITNSGWLAVGREAAQGVLNITGGTMVRTGDGNISLTHNTGASSVVNISGTGTFISATGETWVGENGGPATWNMNGGTAILNVVHLAENADATGVMNLNGGSLTAAEISTGNAGAAQRELNLNGGTLVAGADNTNFIHDLSTANVQSGGAIIDSAAYTVSVNQDLLGAADDGGLTKLGSGTLYLNGVNTYTNATTVSAGALGGSGTIAGAVTVAPGARLAPGTALIGTLTINNSLSLAAGSSTLAKISMDGGAHNDLVTGLTSVAYNGALVVTNAGASPLVVGSQFHLFNAAGESGNFTSVTILPAGSGTFDPATGMLTITSSGSVVFNPVKLSGGNLILTGNGGAAPGSGYTLLTSTNVALPLSEWTTNTTGVLDDAGMFSNSIPMDAADTARFFDVRVP
jgi:autotransporter-associated beta strand protein